MTMIVTSEYTLTRVAPPSLPTPPAEYDPRYVEQFNNVLRLYFNRLNGLFGQLTAAEFIPALTNYTVATLPSAATAGIGARSFVTDATAPTFGSTVAGGGAVATPVYSDGTNWKVG
jgi:hypothetical protein